MTLEKILNTDQFYFVALQYHTLILNRRLIVLCSHDRMIVLKVGGILADEHPYDGLANFILAPTQVIDDKYNALKYVQKEYINKYLNYNCFASEILSLDKNNKQILFSEIIKIRKNDRWKWGMGSVPYTGRIIIKTKGNRYEFIILGNQDLDAIYQRLLTQVNRQKSKITSLSNKSQ